MFKFLGVAVVLAMAQSPQGEPWTRDWGNPTEGAHLVVAYGDTFISTLDTEHVRRDGPIRRAWFTRHFPNPSQAASHSMETLLVSFDCQVMSKTVLAVRLEYSDGRVLTPDVSGKISYVAPRTIDHAELEAVCDGKPYIPPMRFYTIYGAAAYAKRWIDELRLKR